MMEPRSPKTTMPGTLASLLAPPASLPLWNDSDLEAILLHQLRTPVGVAGTTGTFEEHLLAEIGDAQILQSIKSFCKASRDDFASGIPGDVCHVLYYAAIAAAQVHAANRLTRLDDASLATGLRWAMGRIWVPQQLKDLLHKAHDALRQHG
jgi:hypothetical protein